MEKRKRILIVHNDKKFNFGYVRILRKYTYIVNTAFLKGRKVVRVSETHFKIQTKIVIKPDLIVFMPCLPPDKFKSAFKFLVFKTKQESRKDLEHIPVVIINPINIYHFFNEKKDIKTIPNIYFDVKKVHRHPIEPEMLPNIVNEVLRG